MQRWLKRTLFGLFGTTLLIAGVAGCGGHHRGQWNEADLTKMRTHILERADKELKLDQSQKQRLATLADKLQEQRTALMAGSADPRAAVQSLVSSTRFDREKAQALVESKTTAVRSKSPEVISAAADFYDSLNPEQQQKVRDFMKKKRGWGRQG